MELRKLLGEQYKNEMSVEDLLKLDVDLISKDSLSGYVSKDVFDKTAKEASEWKQKYKSTLDDSTRQQEENAERQEQLQKELDEFKKQKAIGDLTNNYISLGYSSELAKSSAEAQFNNDNETLFKNMQSFQNAQNQELKNLRQQQTPPPNVNNSNREQGVDVNKMSSYEFIKYQQSNMKQERN